MQAYSNQDRENEEHALPDLEIFQLTAEEQAEQIDEDTAWEYAKDFPRAGFNSRVRQRMIDAIIEGEGLTGGWFYWYCFPGCMPDSEANGPFATRDEALKDAQENA